MKKKKKVRKIKQERYNATENFARGFRKMKSVTDERREAKTKNSSFLEKQKKKGFFFRRKIIPDILVGAELLHGDNLSGGLDNGDVDLAVGFPLAAVLAPGTAVVGLETVVEVGVLVPRSAGTVLGPFVRKEFLGALGILRAREPVGGELTPKIRNLVHVERGRAAVGRPAVLGVLRPETVKGVGTRRVAKLESKDVVVDALSVGERGAGSDEDAGDDGGKNGNEETGHFCEFFFSVFVNAGNDFCLVIFVNVGITGL